MMTQEIQEAISSDRDLKICEILHKAGIKRNTVRSNSHIDTCTLCKEFEDGYSSVEMWEGYQIWPNRSRRMTLLQYAVAEGAVNVLKCLLGLGFIIDYGETRTALTEAIQSKSFLMVQTLLENDADPNKKLILGYSSWPSQSLCTSCPLNVALSNQASYEIIQELLLHGADPLQEINDISPNERSLITTNPLKEAINLNQYETALQLVSAVPLYLLGETPRPSHLVLDDKSRRTFHLVLDDFVSKFVNDGKISSDMMERLLFILGVNVLRQSDSLPNLSAMCSKLCRTGWSLKYWCVRRIRWICRPDKRVKGRVSYLNSLSSLPLPKSLLKLVMLEGMSWDGP